MSPTALARAAAQRGRAWLESSNDAPIDWSDELSRGTTTDAVREAAIAALHEHLGDHYVRRPGIAPLCNAVAEYLASDDIAVDANNGVVISGGMQEARFVAVRALAPGHTIWMPRPAPLPLFDDAARFAGATIELFDPAEEPRAASGDLLIFANPNPATGQVYDDATLARLAQWASSANLTVIADETAAPFVRAGGAFRRFATLPDMADRTLTLGSFAGTPGLAAWHVAWFAGPKTLATKARDLKQSMTICSPALSQYAALAAGPAETATSAAHVEALTTLLDDLAIPYLAPDTTTFVVADVAALGGGDAVARACAAQGVHVTSGSAFGSPDTVQIVATTGTADALAPIIQTLKAQQVNA